MPNDKTPTVDANRKRDQLTREALRDVDDGRVVGHQNVQDWANGLNIDQPPKATDQ